MPWSFRGLVWTLVVVLVSALAGEGAYAATWNVDATASWESEKQRTADGEDTTRTLDQSYTISYETPVHPELSLNLEFTLDVTRETRRPGADTREINPSVELDLAASWWELTGLWELSEDRSDEPGVQTTEDTSWEVEYVAEPRSEALPDVRLTYEQDRSKEGSELQNVERNLEAAVDYTFWDLLEVSLDASRDATDDKVNPDADTEDREYTLDVALDRELGHRVKVEADWTREYQRSDTLADGGGVLDRDETLDDDLRGQVTFVPVEPLELSLERELTWDEDLAADTLEKTDRWTGSASLSASLTETVDLDLSYEEERESTDGGEADSDRTTRDYSFSLDVSPLSTLTFTPAYDRTDEKEKFEDPTQATRDTVDDTVEMEVDGSFWDEQLEFTVTRTWDWTREEGSRTKQERAWDATLTLSLLHLPNLEITPEFTLTEDDDVLKGTTDQERTFEVGVLYEFHLGDVTTLTVDHTYSRTAKDPAEGVPTVLREDDTDVTLLLSGFLRGMELELGLTRNASDESKDDKGPEIDYTYSVIYDWEIYDRYTWSVEYEFDRKGASEDTRNWLTTFTAEFLDGRVTVDLEYELDEQVEGDEDTVHRYLIEVQGTF